MPEIAPGPPGDLGLGHLRAFRRDVLGLLESAARDYGDVVRFRIGPQVVHLVNHPDLVSRVLQGRGYDKVTRSTAALAAICGASLLTTSGADWEARRQTMQPAFHRVRLAALTGAMTRAIATRLDAWAADRPIDVASEMMRLTFVIAGDAIVGADVATAPAAFERDVADLLAHAFARWGQLLPIPRWLPTPANRRFDRALAGVDRVVAGVLAQHRQHPDRRPPLLEMLLDQTAAPPTAIDLRNEVLTLLLAGHETTASAVTWTLALLAAHPDTAERARTEVLTSLGQRVPTIDDLPRLRVTTQVIQEALRLFPPIWAIERRAVEADTIGGYAIRRGSSVIVSPWVLHRHPAFWPDPSRFDPSRFDGVRTPAAYLPFGAGPRFCIGHEFAMLEARLIVAMVLQRFRWTLAPGQIVAPLPSLTLRLRHGLTVVPSTA